MLLFLVMAGILPCFDFYVVTRSYSIVTRSYALLVCPNHLLSLHNVRSETVHLLFVIGLHEESKVAISLYLPHTPHAKVHVTLCSSSTSPHTIMQF